MAGNRKLDERELLAAIMAKEGRAYGYGDGALAITRADAIRSFLAKIDITVPEGRSAIQSTDVRDTVLWLMPQILRTIFSGDEMVRFNPLSPQDEGQAKQETEFVNWVMLERNDAFREFSAFVQDALLVGTGYAKVWWETREDVLVERYFGKSDDELAMLMDDEDVEVSEHTERVDEDALAAQQQQLQGLQAQMAQVAQAAAQDPNAAQQLQQMQAQYDALRKQPKPKLHDLVLRRKRKIEYAKYTAIPPEEIMVGAESRHVPAQDLTFIQHRSEKSLSDIRQMGYEVPDDIGDWFGDTDPRYSQEELARNRYATEYMPHDNHDAADPASRHVVLRESWIRIDWDGDGIAELRRVTHVGFKVLLNEETDHVPIVPFVAIPLAHRHHGIGMYEILRDLTLARQEIIRSYIDGLKAQVRPRMALDQQRTNIDDLLVARANGLVRVQGDPQSALMPLPVAPVGDMAMQGLQWMDQWQATATGINPQMTAGQSIDAAALNETALGMSQQLSMALARVENITRSLVDGVRDLVQLIHALTLKHASKADHIKLNNQWVLVDPRTWVKRDSMTVTVGLGSGTREMRAQQLMTFINLMADKIAPTGAANAQNFYNATARLANELGYRNADEFVTNPAQNPPGPPPEDPLVQAQKIKSQSDQTIKQAELQAKQGEAQQTAQLEQAKMQAQTQQKAQEAQIQAALEERKAQIAAEAQIAVARIKAEIDAQTTLQVEQMKMQGAGMGEQNDALHQQNQASIQQMIDAIQQVTQTVQSLAGEHARRASGKVVRDKTGRVAGLADASGQMISVIERGPDGRLAGVRPADSIQ